MTLYYTLVRNRIYAELWGRKGKCLSTTLTAGLPKVFLRAALIFIKLSGAPIYSCIGNNWRLARLVRRLLVFWMHLASLLAGKPWILYAPGKGRPAVIWWRRPSPICHHMPSLCDDTSLLRRAYHSSWLQPPSVCTCIRDREGRLGLHYWIPGILRKHPFVKCGYIAITTARRCHVLALNVICFHYTNRKYFDNVSSIAMCVPYSASNESWQTVSDI